MHSRKVVFTEQHTTKVFLRIPCMIVQIFRINDNVKRY
jgi:hypothetical protein